jgi:uncharacterized protein YdaU (DUF1376 family)
MPAPNHPPAFQFYVDDFVSDSAVDAMSNDELGIYIRLLCKAWKEEPVGTIPDDDRILANWGKTSASGWKRAKPAILRAFRSAEDGRLHQKRMETEWQKLLEYRAERSRAGARGADKRWHNDSSANGSAIVLPSSSHEKSVAKNSIPSPSSFSSSNKDGDVIENVLLGEETEGLISKARRLQKLTKIDIRNAGDRELIAKTAVLWDAGEFSEADIEHVLQSFKSPNIKNRGAYLHKSLANHCDLMRKDFGGLLARTTVPMCLLLNNHSGVS